MKPLWGNVSYNMGIKWYEMGQVGRLRIQAFQDQYQRASDYLVCPLLFVRITMTFNCLFIKLPLKKM